MYTSALQAPPRFQWEASSAPSAPANCGPTGVAFIAGFYHDATYGIEWVRRLVAPCCRPTYLYEQADMLTRLGIPASLVNVTSLSQLRSLVTGGKRPVILAMQMSRVPVAVRGHTFTGAHTVVCLTTGTKAGVKGFWISDPNFSPPGGIRPDPDHGHRFYSEADMQWAFIYNSQHWAIVPNKPKYIPPPKPAPAPAPTDDRADGDPYPMRYRRITASNDRFAVYELKKGAPIRKGVRTTSGSYGSTAKDGVFFSAWGYIEKADLPAAEQKWGDVLLGNWYAVNGDHTGYVKTFDVIGEKR